MVAAGAVLIFIKANSLGADVVVTARVHRSGLNTLLGSTTEHLLYRSPCSVLAV